MVRKGVATGFAKICLIVAGIAGLAGAASAKDGRGLYFGMFGDYFDGHEVGTQLPAEQFTSPNVTANASGFGGGIQLGYDHLFYGEWVLGAVADVTWGDAQEDTNSDKLIWNFNRHTTVRGKLGLAMDPRVVFYGTAGFSAVDASLTSGLKAPVAIEEATLTGYTYGAGLDIRLARRWWVNLEYLQSRYQSWEFSLNGKNYVIDPRSNVMRIGVVIPLDFLYDDHTPLK